MDRRDYWSFMLQYFFEFLIISVFFKFIMYYFVDYVGVVYFDVYNFIFFCLFCDFFDCEKELKGL